MHIKSYCTCWCKYKSTIYKWSAIDKIHINTECILQTQYENDNITHYINYNIILATYATINLYLRTLNIYFKFIYFLCLYWNYCNIKFVYLRIALYLYRIFLKLMTAMQRSILVGHPSDHCERMRNDPYCDNRVERLSSAS